MAYNNALKGVTVQKLTPSMRDRLNLPEGISGVVITDVASDSPAQGLLRASDVIEEVDRKTVRSVHEYEDIVSKIGEHDTILLLVFRDGGSVYLTIQR